MKVLNLLLGAGFSFNAKLPMAGTVSDRLGQNYIDKLIRRSSSEWAWKEGKQEVDIWNGQLNADWFTVPFIMNEIIAQYNKEIGKLDNYEVFFSFIEDQTHEWFKPLVETARAKFFNAYKTVPRDSVYNNHFEYFSKWEVVDLINYLIEDLLVSKLSDETLVTLYQPFLDRLKEYELVNIYTTNHDLILERIFRKLKIPFNDGFTTINSEIVFHDEMRPIRSFQNAFDKAWINLIKLHGSVDMNKFSKVELIEGVPTASGYIYIKPDGYREKHFPARIDLKTGKVLQTPPNNIIPSFITGVNKTKKIEKDYMYSEMFEHLRKHSKTAEEWLIVGYSYGDEHINELLKTIPTECRITNINPSTKFPFTSFKNVKQFSVMEEKGALSKW